ncbi:MAG: hypothetical protein GF331_11670 [Chitinivibrionales bacterium]|nr:hypothetical protein [Chitinivibrionales bacterium]
MRHLTQSGFILVAMLAVSVHADETLTPRHADYRDPVWIERGLIGVDSYGITGNHVPGTNGDVIWYDFPGPNGRYKVELGAVLEPDGDSPYKFYINGVEKDSGNYPYSTGSLDCNSSTYELADLDLGEYDINNGDTIKYWASSVYPCGTSHGQYSRFYRIRFTLLNQPQDNTPPSVPTGLRGTGTTNTSMTLAWDASSDAESGISGYNIYFGSTLKKSSDGTRTSTTITGLQRNTTYANITVSAVNGRQLESAKSSSIDVTTANESAPAGTMFYRAADGVTANGMMMMSNYSGALGLHALYGTIGNRTAPETTDSKVTFTVDIPSSGNWYAWGRFLFESDGQNNSFWIVVDGGSAQRFGNGEHLFGSWHWEGYMDQGHINLGNLSAGEHTITIYAREPSEQSLLDVLCLTPSSTYVPNDADVDFVNVQPITLLAPVGGETYTAGGNLTIEWTAVQSQVSEVDLFLSTDEGEHWTLLNPSSSVSASAAEWGSFDWPIPADTTSTLCLVKVENYNDRNVSVQSPAVFTIQPGAGVYGFGPLSRSALRGVRLRHVTGGLEVAVSGAGAVSAALLDLRGRTVASLDGAAPMRAVLPVDVRAGVYFLRITAGGSTQTLAVRGMR